MITVVINTLNEEANILECIKSVRELADEILVCDMYSDDRTVELAQAAGARIEYHERVGFVEPARRFAIEKASSDWVLVLDADERMTPPLAQELRRLAIENRYAVVSFWSLYWYFGGWVRHGGFFNGHWRRFFKKNVYLDTYMDSEALVHMNFEALHGHPDTCYLTSEFYIKHYAYESVEKYMAKTLGRYATIEGKQYLDQGICFSLTRMLWEPLREFMLRFILRKGYKDGMRGLILSALYSGYRFSVWANVWFASLNHCDSLDMERVGKLASTADKKAQR